MKKVRNVVLFLVLLLCFSRCENDRVSEEAITQGSSFTVEQAEAWFGADWQGTVSLKSGNTENARIGIKPDWCNGFTSQNDEVEVVEVGLLTQGRFDLADEASYNEWVKTKNPRMIRSLTRMVFLKFKKDGRIDQFLMTIVGDKEYHENQVSRLSDNAYLSREKHFSGRIYYHDLKGKFVNGWVYEKGKLVGITFQKEGPDLPTDLKMATTCITTITTITYVRCTEWYQDTNQSGEYDDGDTLFNTNCGDPFTVTSIFTECPVYFTGGGNFGVSYLSSTGGGGANGGYNPTVQPPCNCANVCDVCKKCKDELLKSGSVNCIPWEDCDCPPPTREQIARNQLDYLKARGGSELAAIFEQLLLDPTMPMSDVYAIFDAIENAYLQLKAEYMMAVFSPDNVASILGMCFTGLTSTSQSKAISYFASWECRILSNSALIKNNYFYINGFKFSDDYYLYLWNNGRPAPSLIAKEVLENAITILPDEMPGFYKYFYQNLKLVYNPITKEIIHIGPL